MNSNSSLNENATTASAKIEDFNGPGVGKLMFANEFK